MAVKEGYQDEKEEEEEEWNKIKNITHTSMPEVAPRSTRLKSRQNISTGPSRGSLGPSPSDAVRT